jgi:hypothetical protein
MKRVLLILVFVPLALAAILPARVWRHRGPLAYVPTNVPGSVRVASCQRYAAHWTPAHSDRTLRRWEKCMGLRP